MGLALLLGHRVVVGDGTGGVERVSAGARRRRRPNSSDEKTMVGDTLGDGGTPGRGQTRQTVIR